MIEVLKQALEALESMANEGWLLHGPEGMDVAQTKCVKAITSLRQAIAKLESQEPVAWRFKTGTWWNREVHWRYVLSLDGTEGLLGLEPLYTHPSQRTEREPDVVMHWHSHTWTTINPPPKNSGDVNLYYAPPQRTEQEPVAWMRDDATLRFTDGKMFAVGQPFYTHPPQRTWVGLTDKEFAKCWHSNPDKAMKNVEAKLKEKNS